MCLCVSSQRTSRCYIGGIVIRLGLSDVTPFWEHENPEYEVMVSARVQEKQ